jgi:serine/threonine-protein kinase ULK/ATG1
MKGNNFKVALKQYDKSKLFQDMSRVEALRAEIDTLNGLDHIGIMKFYDAIDSGNKVTIIVEYINGNNLFQYIRKMP